MFDFGQLLVFTYYTLIAYCQYLLTGGRFLPFIRISVLRIPHATCIFMSHRVALVKSSPLQFKALQMVATVGFNKI